eukprot:gene8239-5760_t
MGKKHQQPQPIDIAAMGKPSKMLQHNAAVREHRGGGSPVEIPDSSSLPGTKRRRPELLQASRGSSGEDSPEANAEFSPGTIGTITAKRRERRLNAPSRQAAAQTALLHGHDMVDSDMDEESDSEEQLSYDSDEIGSDGNALEESSSEASGSASDPGFAALMNGESSTNTEDSNSDSNLSQLDEDEEEEEEGEEDDSNEEFEEGGDDEEDEGEDEGKPENVTVNFGVFDMEKRHVDATIHLMDQFCPDKLNEVDRDEFAAALLESPYTSIVKMADDDSGDSDEAEEEEEVCGLCSVLHFRNCCSRHPAAFEALHKLLDEKVWRTAVPGIPPLELLRTKKDSAGDADSNNMKALLWVMEQIQTIPLELTIQVMLDTLGRLEDDAEDLKSAPMKKRSKKEMAESLLDAMEEREAGESYPCLFVMLAKVQRAVAPAEPVVDARSGSSKERSRDKRLKNGAAALDEESDNFAMTDYVFWREEDEVLFGLRDKRVAVVVYRCRPQYEGQPELEIPLSVMFAVPCSAIRQATEELRKRAVAPSSITHFR